MEMSLAAGLLVLAQSAAAPASPAVATAPLAQPVASPAGMPPAAPEPPEPPAYPLGPLRPPELDSQGDAFTLTDLRFRLVDTFRSSQSFAARVRYKDLGYLGAEFEGERRRVTLQTHRLDLELVAENDVWDIGVDYRGRRFAVSSVARALGHADRGVLLVESLAFRLTPELELEGWVVGDTDRPEGRFLREAAGGAFWQHGTALDAHALFTRTYEVTAAGENRRDSGELSFTAQLTRTAELTASGIAAETAGRFPRREGELAGRARLLLAPRLLLDSDGGGAFESGAATRRYSYGGRLTWLARRFTLPRAGERARRALALARQASERGEYELVRFDDDGLRAQRERLSLSPHRRALRDEAAALYRAQVDERAVPLLAAHWHRSYDALSGDRVNRGGVTLALPWRPAWPWRAGHDTVPFLQLDLELERRLTATDFHSEAATARLAIALSRELDLLARWTRTEPSALDLIRGVGRRRTVELSCVYARGR